MNKKNIGNSAPESVNSKTALRVKRITESVIGLPTLPSVVSKMIELVDNPKTSAASLARQISTDQALTSKILKLANSAYYGFPREISTVNLAIVVLGFNTVKDMGLSVSILDAFKGRGESKYFDVTKFWEHSIACGVACRMLARLYQYRIAGEAFVAGLLHDVGKVVLNQYLHNEFCEIMKRVYEKDILLLDAEKQVLETTHAQIGGWLVDKWNLPPAIADAIRFHHKPLKTKKHKEMTLLTCYADYLVRYARVGESGNKAKPELDPEVRDALTGMGIPTDGPSLDEIQMNFLAEFDKAEAFISILQTKSPDEETEK